MQFAFATYNSNIIVLITAFPIISYSVGIVLGSFPPSPPSRKVLCCIEALEATVHEL